MTKIIPMVAEHQVRMCNMPAEALPHRQLRFLSSEQNALAKDAKGSSGEQEHALAKRKGTELPLACQLSQFELLLHKADKELRLKYEENDINTEYGAVQILFDSSAVVDLPATPHLPNDNKQAELEARIERIFADVTLRVNAAIRPFHAIASGPVTITVPIDGGDNGLNRIEVTLVESIVTIKLCLPEFSINGGASEQLVAATSQLGQLLLSHLPGRRIKIVQSADTPNDGNDGEAVAAASSGERHSIFSFSSGPERQ
ncbi:hypothetical protein PDO_5075 [Rhizobium sp. PDO1-076]|uniref:hypothetical protein n=1 Tax=Rhizobium sp. PDO1-076 TaxID=1125979 RepID=UPI00024E2D04|nr:hypothetical protein [Rhizobium sp. PDO1-076]EHS51702.1 hypothetical protein PDO_5075 [Rhizobium sp. PDO1-076]